MKFFNKKVLIIGVALLTALVLIIPVIAKSGRSVPNDGFPQQLNKYTISAELEENRVHGDMTLDFVNKTGETLNELCFCLYPNAFALEKNILSVCEPEMLSLAYPRGFSAGSLTILAVKINGADAEYTLEKSDQILSVKKEIGNGGRARVEIVFDDILPYSPMRYGYGEATYNLGNWYPVLCVYENGEYNKCVYSSRGDPFYSECADYDVTFTAPSGFRVASSGIIDSKSSGNPVKTVWRMSARAIRDFAIVASEKFNLCSEIRGKTVVYSFYTGDEQQGRDALDAAVGALDVFNEAFGEYPYPQLSVVACDFYIGGMEYPNLVMISNSLYGAPEYLEEVVVHETAHQWWYGLVGNDETAQAWIDEGLTQYSTAIYFERRFGKERFAEYMQKNGEQLKITLNNAEKLGFKNRSIDRRPVEFESWRLYDALTYEGAAFMLDSVRSLAGEKVFFETLRAFFEQNKFKNVAKAEFINAFSPNLSPIIDAWLNGNVYFEDVSEAA